MKKFSRLAFALVFSAFAVGAFAQAKVLRVSAIPDEAPTELQRKFKPLGDYLQKETGMEVQFTPVTDYAAVVEGLATNKLDLAWLGGFTFVQARIRTNGGGWSAAWPRWRSPGRCCSWPGSIPRPCSAPATCR